MTQLFLKRIIKTGSLYFCLLIFTFLISPLSKAQDLLKLIPANASGVVTMNGNSFFKKIDLDQINRLEMFQDMDERTQGKRGSKYNEYSKIYKDPASIGLNLLAKSYLYFENSDDTTRWGSKYTYTGVIISLAKSKKFESFVKKVSDSSIVKEGSYKFCKTGYNNLVGWNNSQMILLFISGYGDNRDQLLVKEFKRLINLSSEQCIRTNKNFMDNQSRSTFDFNYWMNFESMMSSIYPAYYMAMPIYKDLPFIGSDFYKEYYLQMNLNFNKGNIALDAKQFLSPESGERIKNVYGKGLNPDFMKYLHKDHLLGVYSYSLNMKGIKAILDTALTDSIKDQMNEGFVELLYEKKIKENARVKKVQAEIDSMYTDLYPPVDYSKYNYDTYEEEDYSDTDTDYDTYEEYDTAYYEEPEPVIPEETEEYIEEEDMVVEEEIIEEEYDEEEYQVDTTYIEEDYTIDTTYSAYDYNYSSKPSKEDSIYNAKYERINTKRDELSKLKKELFQQKLKDLNLNKDFLFTLFEGDAMGAITDYFFVEKKYKAYEYDDEELKTIEVEKTKKDPRPEFLVGFTLNDVAEAKKLAGKLTKDSFLLQQNNYYKINMEWPVDVYIAISNNLLLITNNEELLKKNFSGYSEGERVSKEVQDILLNKTSSGYINIKDIFVRIPYENLSPERHATYSILMNSFQTLSFTSSQYNNNISQSDMSLNLTNKIDNSFYDIFRIINEIYKINRRKY